MVIARTSPSNISPESMLVKGNRPGLSSKVAEVRTSSRFNNSFLRNLHSSLTQNQFKLPNDSNSDQAVLGRVVAKTLVETEQSRRNAAFNQNNDSFNPNKIYSDAKDFVRGLSQGLSIASNKDSQAIRETKHALSQALAV